MPPRTSSICAINEPSVESFSAPSLSEIPDMELGHLGDGGTDERKIENFFLNEDEDAPFLRHDGVHTLQPRARWSRRLRLPFLQNLLHGRHRRRSSARGRESGVKPRRPRLLRVVAFLLTTSLMLLGVIQLIGITFGAIATFFPDEIDWVLDTWGDVGLPSEGLGHWPTDFTGDVIPVACHSHNDYWRPVPLYSAIDAGCVSVEADVWLFEDELYVGHSWSSLTPNRTLTGLYIDPLLDILEKQNPITLFHPEKNVPPNGVFDTSPRQPLILLIDFKTNGSALFSVVSTQLERLREKGYLSYWDGQTFFERLITIVATGNAPFNLIVANETYRDIFFDAPLDQMAVQDASIPKNPGSDGTSTLPPADGTYTSELDSISTRGPSDVGQGHSGDAPTGPSVYSPANSYYASVSFASSIGFPWRNRLSRSQLDLLRRQIRGAHDQGLKVRYWNLPSWPRGLRNHIWHILIREGVDILNVDDLTGATRRDWRKGKGWWY